MNADLMAQMVDLRDLAAELAEGVPTIRSLIVRKRVKEPGYTLLKTTFLEISPKPHIVTVSPRLAGAYQNSSLVLEIDDFQVNGISTRYGYNDLVGTGISYFVDGVLNDEKTVLVSGIECDFIDITHSKGLCWDMILRRKPDER